MNTPSELVCRDCGKRYPHTFPECPKCYLLRDPRAPDDGYLEKFKQRCRQTLADVRETSRRRNVNMDELEEEIATHKMGIGQDLLSMFEFCKVYRVSLGSRRAYYTNHDDAWYAYCHLRNKFKGRTDIFYIPLVGLPRGIVPDFEIIHTTFNVAHFPDE